VGERVVVRVRIGFCCPPIAHATANGRTFVPDLGGRVKLCFKMAFSFRTFEAAQMALYQAFGDFTEPKFTHRFCGGGEHSCPRCKRLKSYDY
jgi:hypothetical protein